MDIKLKQHSDGKWYGQIESINDRGGTDTKTTSKHSDRKRAANAMKEDILNSVFDGLVSGRTVVISVQ